MIRLLLIIVSFPFTIYSQDFLKGKVVDDQLNPLINASVYWINTQYGTSTDKNGEFKLIKNNIKDQRLIISFIGFKSDTIKLKDSQNSVLTSLKPLNQLNNIIIKENAKGINFDKSKALKIETITAKELTKAACCDLAGCFETQLSVNAKTTNVILNSKELSLLGLSGVYNQVLIDGIPIVIGLNYTYGISSIPGTLIKQINISQGLASVLQGSNSISGQINISLKEFEKKDLVFLNLYYNSFGARQINLDYNFIQGKWKSIVSLHTTQPAQRIDNNHDQFLDLPLESKYSFYNKWIYGDPNKGLYTIAVFRYLDEQRIGGQIDFDILTDKGSNEVYGQTINFQQPELINKVSYRFNKKHALKFESGFSYHNQSAYYGTTHYLADQINLNINIAHVLNWKSHKLICGINFNKLKINEQIDFNDIYNKTYTGIPKNENVPGLYLENNFNWNSDNSQIITGLNIDHHNEYGLLINPRGLIKHNFSENTIIRFSLGSGWRTFNLFSEHGYLLASNKNIIIDNNLKPEKAINYGFNVLQAFYFDNLEMQILLDYYKTDFSNQIHPDYQHNSLEIHVHNFEGNSKSNSFQLEVGLELYKKLGVKLGYNYLDIFQIKNDNSKYRPPLTSKHHFLNTISYRPLDQNWFVDINCHYIGKKKLIDTSLNPSSYQRQRNSNPYWLINGQFTLKVPKYDFEIYLGCENIFNFKQEHPIISWEDPFGQYFDISNSWGPTKGREYYIGIRARF